MQAAATNIYMLVLMLVLGITPILKNGFNHWILYLDVLLVGGAALWALAGRQPRWQRTVAALFGGYILVALFTVFTGVHADDTLYESMKLMLYLGVYFLASSTLTSNQIYRLRNLLVLVMSLIAATGILYFLFLSSGRIESTFINSNPLGLYLLMGFFFSLYPYLDKGGKGFLLAATLTGTAAMLTGSRGTMVAGALPYAITAIWAVKARRTGCGFRLIQTTALILILVLLVSLAAPWLQAAISDTTKQLPLLQQGQALVEKNLIRAHSFASSSVGGRWSFWQVALKQWRQHPIVGVGAGNYHNVYFQFWNNDQFYSRFVHNQYLQVLAETGGVGAMFFTASLLTLICTLWRRRPKGHDALYMGFLMALIAFLLHIGVDFTWDMPAVTLTFWAAAGMAWALTQPAPAKGKRWLAVVMVAMLLIGTGQFASAWYAQQGTEQVEKKQYRQALAAYQTAAKIYPWRDSNWSGFSYASDRLYRLQGDEQYLNQAIAALDKALAVNTANSYLLGVRAGYFAEAGEESEAEQLYRQAVTLSGFYPQARVKLGNFYLKQHQYAQAEAVFSKAISLYPWALSAAPNVTERVKLMFAAAELHQGAAEAQRKLGRGEAADEHSNQADKILKQARRLMEPAR